MEHLKFGCSPLKRVFLRIQFSDGLHDVKLRQRDRSGLIIRIMILHAVEQFSGGTAGDRFVMDFAESHARKIVALEFVKQFPGIDPLCRERLERQGIAYPDVQVAQFAAEAGGKQAEQELQKKRTVLR